VPATSLTETQRSKQHVGPQEHNTRTAVHGETLSMYGHYSMLTSYIMSLSKAEV